MKSLSLIALAGALVASSASAAPFIDLSIIGFSDVNATGFNNLSTTINFLGVQPYAPLTCVGAAPSVALCAPSTATFLTGPMQSGAVEVWTLGAMTFTSNGAAWAVEENAISGGVLSGVTIFGTYTAAGFDPTPGRIVFSAQAGSPIGAAQQVTWSAQGSATGVPEPGSLALLGSGLVGLGFIARRRTAKK